MNIIQAWESPDFFRPLFGTGLSSWTAWRSFVKALYGLPFESEEETLLYQLGTLRETVPEGGFSECYAVCGRRGGKSRICSLILAFESIFGNWRERVAPGERAWAFCIATDKDQAHLIMSYAEAFIRLFDNPKAKDKKDRSLIESQTQDEINLTNGVSIAVKSCTFRASRGYSTCLVILDELAFMRDEFSANPAQEIVISVLPGLIPGARLVGISTPYGKLGYLWQVFREHYGKEDSDILVWKADTLTMNPLYDQAMIKRLSARDPALAAEYAAEFREDVSAFLPLELIELSATGQQALPESGRAYTAFVDPSGGRSDSMTIAIAHMDGEKIIVDRMVERQAPFDPQEVVKEFSDLIKAYSLRSATSDRYGGVWVSDSFMKQGIRMDMAELSASEIYLNFAALLSSGRVELIDDERLTLQLQTLERRTGRSGKDAVDHPPGLHDDLANSVAGAVVLASHDRAWTLEEQESRMPQSQSGRPAHLIRPIERAAKIKQDAEREMDAFMRESGCSPIIRR